MQDLPLSPALQLIGKAKPTLEGRKVAILVADDSNAEMLENINGDYCSKGKTLIVAPKISITLNNGETIAADSQLAGSPSVLFDAIVSIIC